MLLRDATPAEIDEILSATHALWGDGLEERAYKEYVATLMASAWGRGGPRGFRFLAFREQEGGPILAAMKLYRLTARLDGRAVQVGGVGAVFTMPAARRRGHAAAMLERAHAIMQERGDALSLLFSEIGAPYYTALGYQELPPRAVTVPVRAPAQPPDGVERMRKPGLPIITELRAQADRDLPFALERDAAYWQYLMARHSMPTLWLGPEARESLVLTLGGRGYLWALFLSGEAGPRACILEQAEESPGAALPALRDAFFFECARRGVSSAEAWDGAGDAATGAPVPMWRVLDPSIIDSARAAVPAARFHLTEVF